jgi:hypothetical protein
MFELESSDDSKNQTTLKKCVSCKEIKEQTEFRKYGKGFRTNCIECENKEPQIIAETNEPLVIKSSMGFSAKIENEDTYVISQNKYAIRLQPHEAVALIDWLKINLYPEESTDG